MQLWVIIGNAQHQNQNATSHVSVTFLSQTYQCLGPQDGTSQTQPNLLIENRNVSFGVLFYVFFF